MGINRVLEMLGRAKLACVSVLLPFFNLFIFVKCSSLKLQVPYIGNKDVHTITCKCTYISVDTVCIYVCVCAFLRVIKKGEKKPPIKL